MSLTTLATAKEFLRIAHSGEDTALRLILDAAEDYVAMRAGVSFCSGLTYDSHAENLDGGGLYIWPTYLPVRTITSITDNMDDGATVATGEYFIGEGLSCIERWDDDYTDGTTCEWEDGRRRYAVTYTAGYTSTDIPDRLTMAILQYCYRAYHGRDSDSGAYDPASDRLLNQLIASCSLRKMIS